MSEWSDFHSGVRPQRDQLVGSAETIRREVAYRGFLIHRTNPDHGHMWLISDPDRKDVAGLGGAFTKLALAQDAVDRHIADKRDAELVPN